MDYKKSLRFCFCLKNSLQSVAFHSLLVNLCRYMLNFDVECCLTADFEANVAHLKKFRLKVKIMHRNINRHR